MADENKKLDWLEEFEQLADDVLSQQETSACDQIHPIVADWYYKTISKEPPASRDSVMQALVCLTSELMADMPDEIFEALSQYVDEDEVALWLQEILLIGRAFEQSLKRGDLDDL